MDNFLGEDTPRPPYKALAFGTGVHHGLWLVFVPFVCNLYIMIFTGCSNGDTLQHYFAKRHVRSRKHVLKKSDFGE